MCYPMTVSKTAFKPLRLLLFSGAMFAPAHIPAQQGQQIPPPEESTYGSKFFDQLRSIFGRFRDADLQRVFQQAKPIQCPELVGRKGEWRPVAFFNEDRRLGDWCRESLEEVKTDLAVYTFKGVCSGDQGAVQVSTEFPIAESIEDYNRQKIDLNQIDVTVNDPVTAVFSPQTMAYTFALPYLFLTGHQGSINIYSFVAPNKAAAYATDVTSRWECKAVSSNDVTYRFLICRTATVPRGTAARHQNWEPSFGASAFFILSDGTEAQTSVNLSFGNGDRPTVSPTETTAPGTPPSRPYLAKPGLPRLTVDWHTPDARSKVVDAASGEFRLIFSSQTWSGKIGKPELLSDEKMSSLELTKPREGVDYCIWQPGDSKLVNRLLSEPPDADVSYSFDTIEKTSMSSAAIIFVMKTRSGIHLGKLLCDFPREKSPAEIAVDRWVSVVGGHLTLEIRQ